MFSDFDQAYSYALDELKSRVQQQGRLAGTDADEVEVFVDDSICSATDGTRLFLGRTLTAQMAGNPHLKTIQSPHENISGYEEYTVQLFAERNSSYMEGDFISIVLT